MLVAVSIPIFTAQLEKSREATDEANIRSLYAETSAAVLAEDTTATTSINNATLGVAKGADGVYTGTATIKLSHQKDGLEGKTGDIDIGGVKIAASSFVKGGTATIIVKSDGTAPTITIAA